MRLHVPAVVLTIAAACGENLPVAEDPPDASVDASADSGAEAAEPEVDADADAGCAAPCNAVEVATATPRAIAASPAAMIWLEGDTVFVSNPDGGAPVPVMIPLNGATSTGFLAIHATTALMTQGSGVNRCNTNAPCGDNPGAPIFSLSEAGPIVADATEIFVADRAGQRRLVSCGLTLGCGGSAPTVAHLPDVATRITLTSSFVVVALADKTLRAFLRSDRLEAGVASPAPLATVSDLRGLAGDGPDVYWTDGAAGIIGRCRVGDCASTKVHLLTKRDNPRAIGVSAGKAYWVETDDDAVLRCTLPACSDATVIARVSRPIDLAIGDRIYVTTESTQRIYAIAP